MGRFLTPVQLDDFVRESSAENKLSESLLEFELRELPVPHFCGWCGLGVHSRGYCSHGN